MENSNNTPAFNPVQPKTKNTFQGGAEVERFPNEAVLTVSAVEEGKSKYIRLSTQAIETLGLSSAEGGTNRISITKGHKVNPDGTQGEEALFVFGTTEKETSFVNSRYRAVKLPTPSINFNTRKFQSSKMHGFITEFMNITDNTEAHFTLSIEYGDGYWMLTRRQEEQPDTIEASYDTEGREVHVGETVATEVH